MAIVSTTVTAAAMACTQVGSRLSRKPQSLHSCEDRGDCCNLAAAITVEAEVSSEPATVPTVQAEAADVTA